MLPFLLLLPLYFEIRKTDNKVMRNIAVILAGGVGSRMGYATPKQFLELAGRPVIAHSIDVFASHAAIDEVAVVVHPEWRGHMEEIAAANHWEKLKKIIDGGDERYRSSMNAVAACQEEPDDTNLLFHDAARPWVSGKIITRVLEALRTYEAVGVAIPSADTVWEVEDGAVREIPDRSRMWLAQTPQAFRLPLVAEAYRRAMQDPDFMATDDCSVVRKYMPEVEIHVVEGDKGNTKITYAEDIVS